MSNDFELDRGGDDDDGMVRVPVLWPVVIGAVTGVFFYVVIAFLVLHLWIGSYFDPEPFALRVMSDPINSGSFLCFTIAMAMLWARGRMIRRENRAFQVNLLSADDQRLILRDDALEYRKRLRQLTPAQRKSILFRLLSSGLQRARANWSSEDAGAAVSTQAELIQGDVDSQYQMIRYLAWAIPSIGFIGTVLGIGQAMGSLKAEPGQDGTAGSALEMAAKHLNTAFDTTFVALVLSLILMFYVHRIQGKEDAVLVRATNWCMQRFVFRMHIPSSETALSERLPAG